MRLSFNIKCISLLYQVLRYCQLEVLLHPAQKHSYITAKYSLDLVLPPNQREVFSQMEAVGFVLPEDIRFQKKKKYLRYKKTELSFKLLSNMSNQIFYLNSLLSSSVPIANRNGIIFQTLEINCYTPRRSDLILR